MGILLWYSLFINRTAVVWHAYMVPTFMRTYSLKMPSDKDSIQKKLNHNYFPWCNKIIIVFKGAVYLVTPSSPSMAFAAKVLTPPPFPLDLLITLVHQSSSLKPMHRPFCSKRISASKHTQFIGQYQNCRQLASNESLIQPFTQHSTNSISELNLKIPKPQLPLGSHPFVLSRHFTHLAPRSCVCVPT